MRCGGRVATLFETVAVCGVALCEELDVGVYCRILLADRRMQEARPWLDRVQHQAYSNPMTNCEILQGLYTGKYYQDCVQFYKGLVRLDPSGQNLGEALSYHAALKAAYQIHDYRQSIQIYETRKRRGLRLTRPVVYIVAEVRFDEV